MAIVCIQLTEIAMDVDLGSPGEGRSFPADSGCLLDEACIGQGSISANKQITAPGKWMLERFSAGCWARMVNSQAGITSCL